ncbi:hypothetical protein [Salinisphaera hydrothermalis]|uniref:Uncharacterized protein n=1 Tax=Salinisphaera hydrothermalis (strain C41B8) TaxID=1304275 RepID=A0A084IPT8_SALHC|nr:hypothetical protein [Salinisphaera hydrothermalis]KEZ78722.1 hypothetical protein C41B8_03866 [Salinisphaera hydrothermalis C41B8]
MSVGAIAASSQHAIQAQMQASSETRETPGVADHDGDNDGSGAQASQAAAASGPRVNASGQTIGQHINVTA